MMPQVEFSINKITFSSNDTLELEPNDLVVFVGPNNSGKSSTLREIICGCGDQSVGPVLKSVETSSNVDATTVKPWLESNFNKTEGDNPQYGWIGTSIPEKQLSAYLARNFDVIAKFLLSLTDTESRLDVVKPQKATEIGKSPRHPFHVLFNEFEQEKELSGHFKAAFGFDLMLQRVGANVGLHLGQRDLQIDSVLQSVERLSKLPKLEEQGDGMKSFVGTLLNLTTSPGLIHLIDEPEAFLHPPQAQLMGRIIGDLHFEKAQGQLFIATHSGEVLKGLIESKQNNLKIVRLTRSAAPSEENRIKTLPTASLKKLWDDPVMRFSNALDAIFHECCVICEFEADCLFYWAVADALNNDDAPDTMYLGAGGKHGTKKLVEALESLGIPIAVVCDFDVLNDKDPLSNLVDLLGGSWSKIESDWKSLKQEVENKKPPLNKNQVDEKIKTILENESDDYISVETQEQIKDAIKAISPWSEPKRLGIAYFDGGTESKVKAIISDLSKIGIWAVPVGEMEGFVSVFRTSNCKGSKWVAKVLREIDDLRSDSRLEKAREFMESVVASLIEKIKE